MTFGDIKDSAGLNTDFAEGALCPGGLKWECLLYSFFVGLGWSSGLANGTGFTG